MKKGNIKSRKLRTRAKISARSDRPRLSVYRSLKHIYAQIIDDAKGATLVSASSKDVGTEKGKPKKDVAVLVGEDLAKKALRRKIKKVVLDKGGYKYHGRIKALADAARKGGLEF